MINEQIIIISVFLLAVIVNLVAEVRDDDLLRAYSKPLLLPLLLAYYLLMSSVIDILVVIALLFAFTGDIILLFKNRKHFFRAGIMLFLCSHIFFSLHFLMIVSNSDISLLNFLWPLVPAFLPTILAWIALGRSFRDYKPFAFPYMIVASIFFYFCILMFFCQPVQQAWMPFTGAVMYLISDTMIALARFGNNFRYSGLLIMVSYIVAVSLLVFGVL